MGSAFMHGWISLPTEGEMYLEHGVPRQVRVDSKLIVDMERMAGEIADITGLHVTLGKWEACDDFEAMAADIEVNAQDVSEVLNRLAHASAEIFYDRYHKQIDDSDTDFDDEACAQDFNVALRVCHLQWDQLDRASVRENYRRALHQAAAEYAAARGLMS